MRKLEIDLMPATKAQISVDFGPRLENATNGGDADVLLVDFTRRSGTEDSIPAYLTGGVADAINLKNIQFQDIKNVKRISLVVQSDIAGNAEVKEYDLSPYNTMDAFQREKITIDGSITARKGTRIYVRFEGITNIDADPEKGVAEEKPSCVMFADLTRHYCC